MSKLYLKPAPDRAVPVPEKGGVLLAEQGEWVDNNSYWQRRLNDQDVLEVPTDEPTAAKPAKKEDKA